MSDPAANACNEFARNAREAWRLITISMEDAARNINRAFCAQPKRRSTMLTIDEIKIEGEEDGFHLIVYTDGGGPVRYRIGLADQFHAETVRTIGRWLAEGEAARPLGPGPGWIYRSGAPYPDTDPKHPDYHDTMSGIHDNRKGK